jgi:hypothetical protein
MYNESPIKGESGDNEVVSISNENVSRQPKHLSVGSACFESAIK